MTKEEIALLSEEELIDRVTTYFIRKDVEPERARELAENFLQTLVEHQRTTAMLEGVLVERLE